MGWLLRALLALAGVLIGCLAAIVGVGTYVAVQEILEPPVPDTVTIRTDDYAHCVVADSIIQWKDGAPVIVMLACPPEEKP